MLRNADYYVAEVEGQDERGLVLRNKIFGKIKLKSFTGDSIIVLDNKDLNHAYGVGENILWCMTNTDISSVGIVKVVRDSILVNNPCNEMSSGISKDGKFVLFTPFSFYFTDGDCAFIRGYGFITACQLICVILDKLGEVLNDKDLILVDWYHNGYKCEVDLERFNKYYGKWKMVCNRDVFNGLVN